jgi:hypothetical protein
MSRALLTVVFLACIAAAAPASATATGQVSTLAPDTVPETASRRPPPPSAEPVMVVAAGIVPERPGVPPNTVDSRSSKDDAGWRTYGTLLATLVLMAAIALRRHSAGGP